MAGSKSGTTAEAAKLIRADIKAAARNSELGTYPDGITFSVRTQKASFMSAVEVTINNAPDGWAYTDDPRGIPGLRQVSEDCKQLGRALQDIIARHFQADGSIYFADVQLDTGTSVPVLSDSSPEPARYLMAAGIAPFLGMTPPALAQAIWRNRDHPVPRHDAELLPGHGKGPDKGWLPARIPDWQSWLEGLPGRGAGGGRPPGGQGGRPSRESLITPI